jgi:hypothetical protein
VVANQDRGKSFFVKNELKKFQGEGRRNFIFDINGEYLMFKNEIKKFPTRDEFLKLVPCNTHPPSKCNVIFEEATAFFSRAGVTPSDLNIHIFRRHHSKNLNIFVFHSLLMIPKDILFAIDFFVIFNTSDSIESVEKHFASRPSIIEAFKDVKQKTANTFFNRDKKTYSDEHSRKFFHYKRIVAKD